LSSISDNLRTDTNSNAHGVVLYEVWAAVSQDLHENGSGLTKHHTFIALPLHSMANKNFYAVARGHSGKILMGIGHLSADSLEWRRMLL
jgi:hypothetical protein